MNTKDKGDAAEASVLAILMRSGKHCLLPYGDNRRYDIVVDERGRFVRIQVKCGRIRNGCLVYNTTTVVNGKTTGRYNESIDYFGVYCFETDKLYLVPERDAPIGTGSLRLDNNKKADKKAKYAATYEFDSQSFEEL